MSVKQIGWAVGRKCSNPLAKLILIILADRADKEGWSFMAQATIAKRCGMDRKTVNRQLSTLVSDGHILRVQRFKDGRRLPDHIQIRCTSEVQGVVPERLTIPFSPYGVDKEEGEVARRGVACGLRLVHSLEVSNG